MAQVFYDKNGKQLDVTEDEIPVRDYMTDPNTKWRYINPPNYTIANTTFFRERTMKHKPGSLEQTVENLVKTFEMEFSHKLDVNQLGSIDKEKFYFQTNGGRKYTAEEVLKHGTYKALMATSPIVDVKPETYDSFHHNFRTCFPEAFAWELLELFSGPPVATFTWHHWGTFLNPYKDTQPNGEMLHMYGSCVARVNEKLKLEGLEFYYDAGPFMAVLQGGKDAKGCPYFIEDELE